jgi:hypothetical protein
MARYSWEQIPECIVSAPPSRASFDPCAALQDLLLNSSIGSRHAELIQRNSKP